jgi:hypothetical protein
VDGAPTTWIAGQTKSSIMAWSVLARETAIPVATLTAPGAQDESPGQEPFGLSPSLSRKASWGWIGRMTLTRVYSRAGW